jgi:hypothetical protein
MWDGLLPDQHIAHRQAMVALKQPCQLGQHHLVTPHMVLLSFQALHAIVIGPTGGIAVLLWFSVLLSDGLPSNPSFKQKLSCIFQ